MSSGGGITPGVVVEWNPTHARGMMRGTVTRIEGGTVYLRIHRSNPRNTSEVWFDPEEVHRLRVVEHTQPDAATERGRKL